MTTRRAFFRRLGLLTAAIAASPAFLAKLPTPISVLPCHASVNPFDAFRLATESLPAYIYSRVFSDSIWTGFVSRGEFPSGMGEVKRVLTYKE